MEVILTLASAAAYGVSALAVHFATRIPPHPQEHQVDTPDGWSLTVAEYGQPGGPVVFLQHGLAATGDTFNLGRGLPSPAPWLAARGFHVFVGNLRGRPRNARTLARTWSFSDYLVRDLPAVIGFIRARTGRPVHWVGHSMGGILGLSYAGHYREGLASVTSLGSALHYAAGSSIFKHAARLRPALARIERIPWRIIQQVIAPVGWLGLGQSPLCNARNMHGRAIAATLSHVFIDMTRDELLELGTSFDGDGGIHCRELGRALPQLAAELPVPWLSVIGAADLQCPPDCAAWTFERIRAPEKRLLTAGRASGHRHDYGHFDLVAGKFALEEIWPAVADFVTAAESSVTKI